MAADRNHIEAMYNIGLMYYKGHGVRQDKREAQKYFRIVADTGHVQALSKLQALERKRKKIVVTSNEKAC